MAASMTDSSRPPSHTHLSPGTSETVELRELLSADSDEEEDEVVEALETAPGTGDAGHGKEQGLAEAKQERKKKKVGLTMSLQLQVLLLSLLKC